MDDDDLTFGQWLQRRRKALRLTQQQLGERAGCSAETIRKYEADNRRPAPDILDHLAAALQVPDRDYAAFGRFAGGGLVDLTVAVPASATPGTRPLHAPSNLPVPLTSLVGRGGEIAVVAELLERQEVRLVTLTGPGGVGKTSVSIAVARALRDAFIDGCLFADLAPLREADLVLPTIAQVLGVMETAGQPLLASVQAYLRERQVLLVLDNFEQVLAAGLVMTDLLQAAPDLKVLVTSRSPLHVRGEREIALDPLGLPGAGVIGAVALSQYDAVRLFIERAQAVRSGFQVTNANAPAVAEICARLDGLPLALELAAARVKLLPPEALLQRLSSRLQLLTGGQRDLPARQQSIRATIDWSYRLLEAAEQTLFARLSVFVGGFTLHAAEAVCNAAGDLPIDVFDGLTSLVDKSLVRQTEDVESGPRFRMLETLQEYALEQLAALQQVERLRDSHLSFFLQFAEQAETEFWGASAEAWLTWMERELGNLRSALDWAREHDPEAGLRLVGAMWWFWNVYGYLSEGRQWAERLLATSPGTWTRTRARALSVAAHLAWWQNDTPRVRELCEESITVAEAVGHQVAGGFAHITRGLIEPERERQAAHWTKAGALFRAAGFRWGIAYDWMLQGYVSLDNGDGAQAAAYFQRGLEEYQALGNRWGIGWMLHNLGRTAGSRGEFAQAGAYLREALVVRRHQQYKAGLADSLGELGRVAFWQGNNEEAQAAYEESIALQRAIGARLNLAPSLTGLGHVALRRGDWKHAETLFREALVQYHEEMGSQEPEAIWCLVGMAWVDVTKGQVARGARLLGACATLIERSSLPIAHGIEAAYADIVAAARPHLDEALWEVVWAEGQAMTQAQALVCALRTGSRFQSQSVGDKQAVREC